MAKVYLLLIMLAHYIQMFDNNKLYIYIMFCPYKFNAAMLSMCVCGVCVS